MASTRAAEAFFFSSPSSVPPFSSTLPTLPLNHLSPPLLLHRRLHTPPLQTRAPPHRSPPYASHQAPPPPPFDIALLEAYTQKAPSEVLLVRALVHGQEDEVLVFKGYSSSLMRATASDLTETVLPPSAVIISIDVMRGPYNPNNPHYMQKGLNWNDFQEVLKSKGIKP